MRRYSGLFLNDFCRPLFRVSFFLGFALLILSHLGCGSNSNVTSSNSTNSKWVLAWADEFSGSGLPDPTIWGFEEGGNGWGNNELQYYTANRLENAKVEDGFLKITAIKETMGNRGYSSARLVTRGKKTLLYGKVEARVKIPAGRGTWPAVWMLGQNIGVVGWPKCGEIDIMEHVGFDPNWVHGSVHTEAYNHIKGTQRTKKTNLTTAISDFHVYAIEWTPEKIDFLIDGNLYFTFNKESNASANEWPFDEPQFILVNLAIGGNWGGQQGVDDSVFPVTYLIDYIRVYNLE
ncbi:MAG: glycoside hydrolase family 16 protein [Chloroherpetonaceae bacterium]|nr:glycoside hydrolase family 16 protein [Chloroherpetonaceae bacterium]